MEKIQKLCLSFINSISNDNESEEIFSMIIPTAVNDLNILNDEEGDEERPISAGKVRKLTDINTARGFAQIFAIAGIVAELIECELPN